MLTEFGKTSIRIKRNPIFFVRHFSFLSDQNFQTVGQLSSNCSEDFAKTALRKVKSQFHGHHSYFSKRFPHAVNSKTLAMYMYILKECIHKDYLSLQKKGVIETNILQQIS